MKGPRAPHARDTAVLRHDGRHPGMAARRRSLTPSAQNKGTTQGGGKKIRWPRWCSLWGGGGVVAGSVERCASTKWWFTPVVAASAPASGPRLVHVLGSWRGTAFLDGEDVLVPGPVLGSSLARRDAAAARPSLPQRRGAAVARPPSPSVLTALRWKKKPQVGAVGFASRPHRLSPFEMASRRLEGESPSVPLAPPPSGAGGAPRPRPGAPWMPAGGANPSFPFSPRAHPVASACTGPWRACRPGGVHTSVTERERESGGAG
jgi:hypothetical protein